MGGMVSDTHAAASGLLARAAGVRADKPGIRARDLAAEIGVSEAELVAARCGQGVRRLDGRWGALIEALPSLGRIMSLVRNEYAVHEKVGQYTDVTVNGNSGLVLGPDIDLRIFLQHWASGFAVEEETQNGPRRSLQFFDAYGAALQKIYLREDSDLAGYHALVERHLGENQSPILSVREPEPATLDIPDEAVDVARLRERWLNLKDVHAFFWMLRDLKLDRLQALRLAGPDLALPLPLDSYRKALQLAAAQEVPIMVFAGNAGIVQIFTGRVQRLKAVGEWFNVLDPGFNLHLREAGIASAWLVRKPTQGDGVVTSIEIFDAEGRQVAWMFGERKPGRPELQTWRALAESIEPLEG